MAWYLDMHVDARAGGTEISGGVQRWVMSCNWKLPTDNIGGDNYHFAVTHGSFSGLRSNASFRNFSRGLEGDPKRGSVPWQVSPGNGHGITSVGGTGYGVGRSSSDPLPAEILPRYYAEHLPEMRQRLGDLRASNAGTARFFSIFPNFSSNGTIRVWHPRGPNKTEAWLYLLVDKEAPREVKDGIRKYETVAHGPNGLIEIDDVGNYISCTEIGRSLIGRQYAQNVQLRLGHEQSHEQFPGKVALSPGEVGQRDFYAWWAQLMDAPSWSQVKLAPKRIITEK
jgi:3-phenylpropionate/trans-cinnamate dioxygenase alpha subunit